MASPVLNNIRSSAAWLRLLYMLIFALAYGVAEVVIFAVTLFQFLTALITGRANARLRNLGAQLGRFVYQVISFLTYASDERPFPFSDWPREQPASEPGEAADAEAG